MGVYVQATDWWEKEWGIVVVGEDASGAVGREAYVTIWTKEMGGALGWKTGHGGSFQVSHGTSGTVLQGIQRESCCNFFGNGRKRSCR